MQFQEQALFLFSIVTYLQLHRSPSADQPFIPFPGLTAPNAKTTLKMINPHPLTCLLKTKGPDQGQSPTTRPYKDRVNSSLEQPLLCSSIPNAQVPPRQGK